MSDAKMGEEHSIGTPSGRDYYVHLLVGITETRHSLATLREYVLSVWQDSDQSDNCQPSQLLGKLTDQFELQQPTLKDDTQLVSDCLQNLKHKVSVWDKQMQLHSTSRLDNIVSEDKINVKCSNNNNEVISKINESFQNNVQSMSHQTINNNNTILSHLGIEHPGHPNETQDKDNLQKQVQDLISQLESQSDQMNSLLRANQNYKNDYRNKLRHMNRTMAKQMASMNRAVTEAESSNKMSCIKCDQFLRRVTSLNSQLTEKKREVHTLKSVVNYNRCSSDYKLKKLEDELEEYKGKSQLTTSLPCEKLSFFGDAWKELKDLQENLTTLEQENTNLRHLLNLEVAQKLQLLNKYNENLLDRRHSLPGRVGNEVSLNNHMYPMRRQPAITLI